MLNNRYWMDFCWFTFGQSKFHKVKFESISSQKDKFYPKHMLAGTNPRLESNFHEIIEKE